MSRTDSREVESRQQPEQPSVAMCPSAGVAGSPSAGLQAAQNQRHREPIRRRTLPVRTHLGGGRRCRRPTAHPHPVVLPQASPTPRLRVHPALRELERSVEDINRLAPCAPAAWSRPGASGAVAQRRAAASRSPTEALATPRAPASRAPRSPLPRPAPTRRPPARAEPPGRAPEMGRHSPKGRRRQTRARSD